MVRSEVLGFVLPFAVSACSLDYLDRDTDEKTPLGPAYYVAPNGSDDRSCEEALDPTTPRKTIESGASCLLPGETVLVRAGTYDEIIGENLQVSGTSWEKKIRIAAYPDETVWLKPTAENVGAVIDFQRAQTFVELDGINIDATNTLPGRGVAVISTDQGNPHHIRFQNAEIIGGGNENLDGSAGGFYAVSFKAVLPGMIGGNELINVKVHGGRGGGDVGDFAYGVNLSSDDNLVERCDIFDWSGGGLQIWPEEGAPIPKNNVVRNNRIHDITHSTDGRIWPITIAADGSSVYNNLIYRNGGGGVGNGINVESAGPSGNQILNNTVYQNGRIGIELSDASTTSVVRNNISFANEIDDYVESGSSVPPNNLFGQDPRFADAANGDFHLFENSPAVDAGIEVELVTTDFEGTSRPKGAGFDIGAYER